MSGGECRKGGEVWAFSETEKERERRRELAKGIKNETDLRNAKRR